MRGDRKLNEALTGMGFKKTRPMRRMTDAEYEEARKRNRALTEKAKRDGVLNNPDDPI